MNEEAVSYGVKGGGYFEKTKAGELLVGDGRDPLIVRGSSRVLWSCVK